MLKRPDLRCKNVSFCQKLGFLATIWLMSAGVAQAQSAHSPLSVARWYVGTQAAFEVHSFIVDGLSTGGAIPTIHLIGGYHFTPGFTLQTGLLYGRANLNEGQQHTITGVPVQLRFTFSQPERRFQVDGLLEACGMLVNRQETDVYYPGDQVHVILPKQRGLNGFVSTGIGLRYAFNQHLEANADELIGTNPDKQLNGYLGFNVGLSSSIGLRYRF